VQLANRDTVRKSELTAVGWKVPVAPVASSVAPPVAVPPVPGGVRVYRHLYRAEARLPCFKLILSAIDFLKVLDMLHEDFQCLINS
jgi:hypothetical protein